MMASAIPSALRSLAPLGLVLGPVVMRFAEELAVKCIDPARPAHLRGVPSDHLWLTQRDGDVEPITTGDGTFRRRTP